MTVELLVEDMIAAGEEGHSAAAVGPMVGSCCHLAEELFTCQF
jgi:hypothetical protein